MTSAIEDLPVLHGEAWNAGGQARVWVDPSDPSLLIKVFHRDNSPQPTMKIGSEAQHLLEMVESASALHPSRWWELTESTAWPTKLYGAADGSSFTGLQMARAGDEFAFDFKIHNGEARRGRPLALQYVISNWFERPAVEWHTAPQFDLAERAEIALSCGRSLSLLWELGFLFGDLSASNVLVCGGERPRAFLIDVDSCRRPGTSGAKTADWAPLDHLSGTVEGERSLFARLVWRLLARSTTHAWPGNNIDEGDLRNISQWLRDAIIDCHNTGSAGHFARLMAFLDEVRVDGYRNAWFEWASASGYARLVLEHLPTRPTPAQQAVLDAARRQVALEESLRASGRTINASTAEPGFHLDLPSDMRPVGSLGSRKDLRALFEAGQFVQIAQLVSGGRSTIPVDGTLRRAIEHALVEAGLPSVQLVIGGRKNETAELRWGWPLNADWVSACVVELVRHGTVVVQQVVDRGAAPVLNVHNWPVAGCEVAVSFAVREISGATVALPRDSGRAWIGSLPARQTARAFPEADSGSAPAGAGDQAGAHDVVGVTGRRQPIRQPQPVGSTAIAPVIGGGIAAPQTSLPSSGSPRGLGRSNQPSFGAPASRQVRIRRAAFALIVVLVIVGALLLSQCSTSADRAGEQRNGGSWDLGYVESPPDDGLSVVA